MRKVFLLALSLVLIAGLIGCVGPNPNKPPAPKKYTMKITFAGDVVENSVSARGVSSPADPVEKDSSWYTAQSSIDHIFGTNFSGGYYWGTAAQAEIVDQYGEPLTMSGEEAENYITWTSPDADGKITLTGDQNWTGYNVSFAPDVPAVLNFTATFAYEGGTTEASARIVIFHMPLLDIAKTDPVVPDGFDLINGTGTTFENTDIWYSFEDGVSYINCPGGISKVLNSEMDPFVGGITRALIGGILQVPGELTYATKVVAEKNNYYIVKPRSGVGYAKLLNVGYPNSLGVRIYFYYEYSPTGVFQLHW